MKVENCDVVIIGSGVAGLICALTLDKNFRIILVTKKKLKDSNSYLAQGGISVCRGKEDREEYILSLRQCQNEETNQPFLDFMARQLKKSLSIEIERFNVSRKKGFSFMF